MFLDSQQELCEELLAGGKTNAALWMDSGVVSANTVFVSRGLAYTSASAVAVTESHAKQVTGEKITQVERPCMF